jgi:1-acyl-sn-glycerol-3-phosphate acyltransferase
MEHREAVNGQSPGAERMGISYWIGWRCFRAVFSSYFRWSYYNTERVPLLGPVILACNHASYIDPPLVGATLRRPIHYMARDSLFRWRWMRELLHSWNAVPVDRDGGGAAGLRVILNVLEARGAIIIFPEGTRSPDGQLRNARSGVGLIVVRSGAQVVPVRVFNTENAYGRPHRIPRPLPVGVKFGRAIDFEQMRFEARSCSKARLKQIYQEIADSIMSAISKLEPYEEVETFP